MRKIENIQLVKVPARPPFAAAFYHVPGPEEINRKFTNFKKARAFVAELEKNLNIGLLLSTLNIKLGLIVNNIVSKISMFNFGWILFIKISK